MKYNNSKGQTIMIWIVFAFYLLLSALGLTLIKMGGTNFSIHYATGIFGFRLDVKLLIGIICYIISFFLFMMIMPKFDLSYIYPIAAGVLYIIIAICAVLLLGEKITTFELVGMVLILSGIVFMNLSK